MPRNRGGGRPMSRPTPKARPAPPPARVNHAPPPAPIPSGGGGGMMSGIGSTIAQGLAFGTGSAMAHRAVDGIMGPRVVQHETVGAAAPESPATTTVAGNACGNQMKAFQDCISANDSDIGKCQFYLDMLKQCQSGPSTPAIL